MNHLPGASPAALALALSELGSLKPVVLVLPAPDAAMTVHEDLLTLGAKGVRAYPQRESLPQDTVDHRVEITARQVDALSALLSGRCRLLVTTSRALAERNPVPVEPGESLVLPLAVGPETSFNGLVERLGRMGFGRTRDVRDVGDFAVRGGIIDLFPFGQDAPVRLEMWGDELTSLRWFDPLTQRSTDTLDSIDVLPISLLSADEEPDSGSGTKSTEPQALLELLPPSALLISMEGQHGEPARQRLWEQVQAAEQRRETPRPTRDLVLHPEAATRKLAGLRAIELSSPDEASTKHDSAIMNLGLTEPPSIERQMKRLVSVLHKARGDAEKVLILCDNDGQMDRLEEILLERRGPPLGTTVALAIGSLSGGFGIPGSLLVMTDHEIFRRTYRRRRGPLRGAPTLESISELVPGDYVVHMDHGIGRFRGMKQIEYRGSTIETMEIEYADREMLQVPHYALELVNRWGTPGAETRPPKVHKLGRGKWTQLRKRTVDSIEATTVELLQLYAKRQVAEGRAFASDSPWMREMESAFLYDETPDQQRAWEAVRTDLESTQPMDRLICGDVGFGKTEIALRASFKVAHQGSQVAVLAPTTVLANQHTNTFRERFASFPIKVETLSRFTSPSDQRRIVKGLADGTVDVVVGTHRLLSRDVSFKDLGLLVVDEEQRFGVRQKERLKELRESVDVLTLTATPIPRTLHLALGGIRDLSLIRTPPRNRMPIVTHLLSWSDRILEEAILRELDRGGQVFFVHDRVETIDVLTERVRQLVPEARLAIGHGQLPSRELESVMNRFVKRQIDVLVCTSIIENGLDLPAANTMIVHQAHQFGLAQLYQLRGRVGRSRKRAWCYLLVPEGVSQEARRRLRVLEHHTELGSGYRVALLDLEMRGAGNLLGGEQSGFASAVGLETYLRLVERTVKRLQGDGTKPKAKVRVSVAGKSFIPDSYVDNPRLKMHLYRRLSRLTERSEVQDFGVELRDRFGVLPQPVVALLSIAELRILGEAVEAEWIRVSGDKARITFLSTATPQLGLLSNALGDRQLNVEVKRLEPLSLGLERAGPEPIHETLADALSVLARAEGATAQPLAKMQAT